MSQPVGHTQHRVQQLIDRLVAEDAESAVQVAAYHRGRLIVDAWAGAPRPAANGLPDAWRGPVDGRTLFPIFSTSKGISATAIHRLVERGVLAYDQPLARWWPEFAQHGKGAVTLRHALTHTAGVPDLPLDGRLEDLCDWDGICRTLAASVPRHAAGEQRLYHAITYSWTLGEVARRADGRDFARIIREEVCQPLGLDSLFIGLPAGEDRRVADVERVPPPPDAPPAQVNPAIPPWTVPLEDFINRTDIRRACMGASNGIANARDIARHYAGLLAGGVDGVELLGPAARAEVVRWVVPTGEGGAQAGRYGLGYGLSGPDAEPGQVFGHGGYGGSSGWADSAQGLAFGFVRSRMSGHPTADLLGKEIRGALVQSATAG